MYVSTMIAEPLGDVDVLGSNRSPSVIDIDHCITNYFESKCSATNHLCCYYEVYNQIIRFEVTFDKQNCVLFCRSHICIEYMNFDEGNDPIGVIGIKTDYTNSLKLIFGTLDKQTRVPFCISHICIDHIKFDVCNFTTVVIVITTD